MKVALASVALVLLLTASCGGESKDERAIKTLTSDFIAAVNSNNANNAYALLSKDTKANCPLGDFTRFFRTARESLGGKNLQGSVSNVKVSGNDATGTTTGGFGGENQKNQARFVKEEGAWRIAEDLPC